MRGLNPHAGYHAALWDEGAQLLHVCKYESGFHVDMPCQHASLELLEEMNGNKSQAT